MKKISKLLTGLSILFALQACTKDFQYEKYTFYRPMYETKAAVKANVKSNAPRAIESPGKIYVKGNIVFLNDINNGIHVIDYSNPSAPVNKAFVNIPGCKDIAVKGNYLYADCYTDLLTIDIADVNNVVLKNYINGVFPNRYLDAGIGTDTGKVIVEWIRVDTMIKKEMGVREDWWSNGGVLFNSPGLSNASSGGQQNGIGGSMAAFALSGNRLYTVDNANLKVFNTVNAAAPQYISNVTLGSWNIETIFPFQDKLFIGSQNGMLIYSLANVDAPAFVSAFQHATMCDPVIADGTTAYVTLRSGTRCTGISNQMDVLNIQNVTNPQLIKTYSMTNPAGLSKDGDKLLVCDGAGGLKMFDASNSANITQKAIIGSLNGYDVIAVNGTAIVSASDGIYFVDYTQASTLTIKGKINVN
ncbi:MAG: hypothetical protein EOP46_19625 [Sphingobacteriaceae bacterium]|nr:MAG: hypothetical protein EOP46_19625 [Sphingobacteriaceae bacterium]